MLALEVSYYNVSIHNNTSVYLILHPNTTLMYHVINRSSEHSLIQRILDNRMLWDVSIDEFLEPRFQYCRLDPYLLDGMPQAVERINQAMLSREKIMIFGDYDVDGITSSFLLYRFLVTYLHYPHVSIMFPNRLTDGYGLKSYHLDQIKDKGVSLVITVDNGITSIAEAKHAKHIWLDLIITDHHKNLPEIPEAIAVINPQVSPEYRFKGICGVGVAFKLLRALAKHHIGDQNSLKKVMRYFLPIVAIGTVADCVPLIHENRLFVKLGLEYLNSKQWVPHSLVNFVDYLKITDPVDTFHIGFLIGPRINAGGRIVSPYESLYTLLYSGEKQLQYLKSIDTINTERKKLQEKAYTIAEKQIDHNALVSIAISEEFHEGVVWIVAGRLSEKHYKPSVVLSIKLEEWVAVWSLRWPEYFNVIDMLYDLRDLLERFGWHKQAWWLTIKLDRLDEFKQHVHAYCLRMITPQNLQKILMVDTHLLPHERNTDTLHTIQRLAPFGLGNEEPRFVLEDVSIKSVQKVWSRWVGHLKFTLLYGDHTIQALQWSKGDLLDQRLGKSHVTVIGKVKPDSYRGGYSLAIDALYDSDLTTT